MSGHGGAAAPARPVPATTLVALVTVPDFRGRRLKPRTNKRRGAAFVPRRP
jgi:hypothetical protein